MKTFHVARYVATKETRQMDRFIHDGLAATTQAVADMGRDTVDALREEQAERTGTLTGSGIGDLPVIEATHPTVPPTPNVDTPDRRATCGPTWPRKTPSALVAPTARWCSAVTNT